MGGDGKNRSRRGEEVASTYGRFIYNVALPPPSGNEADAEDLVQEVLLRVRRGLATYQPGSMEGWLSRITTNAFSTRPDAGSGGPSPLFPMSPDLVLPAAPSADEALGPR